MRKFHKISFLALLLISCSAQKTKISTAVPEKLREPEVLSFLELSYQRGSNSYKFQMQKTAGENIVRSYDDQTLLEQKKIGEEDFSALQAMAEDIFVKSAELKEPMQYPRCRTPFELILVAAGQEKKKILGCRSSMLGAKINEFLHKANMVLIN